jgi:FkbM family methyltransferase
LSRRRGAGPGWRQRVKDLSHAVGVEVAEWRPPDRRLAGFLTRHGVAAVLDVGANQGQFGRSLRAAGFTGRIVSFEPLAEPYGLLASAASADPLWEVRRHALGDIEEERTINVAGNSASSSFLDMGAEHLAAVPEAEYVGAETVRIMRLDDIVDSLSLDGAVTLLKLDVQGFEKPVLDGARLALGSVTAVQCEMSVLPLYDGEAALPDLIADLRRRGFELEELEPGLHDRATGRILQFDGRFVRRV